ncbi:hypothetical protein Tco_0192433 [Tanacetum coccineum]
METIHVTFDEMHQSMAPVRISSGPEPQMMFGQNSSSLVLHLLGVVTDWKGKPSLGSTEVAKESYLPHFS